MTNAYAARRNMVPAIRDRRGRVVFSEQLLDDRAAQGDDLVLTLDKTIQHIAERELELAVRTFEAKGGSAVVVDPRTGEVLALASYPTFNPNEPAARRPAHRRNRADHRSLRAGLDDQAVHACRRVCGGHRAIRTSSIDCEHGALRVAQYTIHDTHQWDELTPAEILELLEQHRCRQDRPRPGPRGAVPARCATSASARATWSACPARPAASCVTTSAGTTWTRPRSRSVRA